MDRDVRSSPEARAVWDFYTALLNPGSGKPFSGGDVAAAADGALLFTGALFQGDLEDGPSSAVHLCTADGVVRRILPLGSRLARSAPGIAPPSTSSKSTPTPTLVLAGALDKNTPPTQALEFHKSVREFGGESALVVYPQDGHSLRGYPAFLDSAARILIWFGRHIG